MNFHKDMKPFKVNKRQVEKLIDCAIRLSDKEEAHSKDVRDRSAKLQLAAKYAREGDLLNATILKKEVDAQEPIVYNYEDIFAELIDVVKPFKKIF